MVDKSRKGQVSLEYLMTYGIAIAIVVIAVAALYSMGVFSGKTTSTPPCSNCFGDFAQVNYDYDAANTRVRLELKNGPADISSMACTAPANCLISNAGTPTPNQTVYTIPPSSTFIVYVPGTTAADVPVSISYVKAGSTLATARTQTIASNYFQ